MNTEKTSKGLLGAGIFSAIAASLCCITPVLALIAGSTGMAASFSWLEPARPYFMGFTVLVLGFVWYQKLKPKKAEAIDCVDDCGCAKEEKTSFMQSKRFLGIMTLFAIGMLAFPYYSGVFYAENKTNVVLVDSKNVQNANFHISGMTCAGCEEHIKHAVAKVPGFIEVDASYDEGEASVKFDASKTNIDEIKEAINSTGYSVTDFKIVGNF